MTTLPAPLAVFVGGAAGGALRLGVDELVPTSASGLPWDIVSINVLGAFAMGMLAAWVLIHGTRWWVPMAGAGALGAFTTFSALAALPWLAEAEPVTAIGVLVGTLVASVAAAGLGWPLGVRAAMRRVRRMEASS